MSKAEKSRFWVTFFLDDIAVGDQFGHGLLHMTLIPWFVSEKPDSEIIRSFQAYFSDTLKFDLDLGEKVILGSKRRAPVTSIRRNSQLLRLHAKALDWFEIIEGRWAVENPHVAEDFHPHIRHRRGKKILTGKITLDSLVLVKARRQEDWEREAAAKVRLK